MFRPRRVRLRTGAPCARFLKLLGLGVSPAGHAAPLGQILAAVATTASARCQDRLPPRSRREIVSPLPVSSREAVVSVQPRSSACRRIRSTTTRSLCTIKRGLMVHYHARFCQHRQCAFGHNEASMARTPSQEIRVAIERALRETGLSARKLEARAGLKRWSLRGILDSARPQVPSVDRAAEICYALGLEIRIGRSQAAGGDSPPSAEVRVAAPSWPELVRRLEELAALAAALDGQDLPPDVARRVKLVRGALGLLKQTLDEVAWLEARER